MRLLLAAVGRLKDGAERDLFERYCGRIAATGRAIAIGPLDVTELAESRAGSSGARKADEARRLIAAIHAADVTVALDEAGKAMTSDAFARWLGERRDAGARTLAFLIGGPDGHGPAVREAAHLRLALGPMTLPHGLARVVLAEQIYRATTILSGHPYHRA